MREIEHDIYRQPVDGQSEVRLNPGEGTIVPPESDVAQIKAGNTVVELVRIGSERAEALGFTADLMRTPYVLVDPATFGTGVENDRTDPVYKSGWKGLWPGKTITIGRDITSDDELRKHGGFDFRSDQTMSKRHFTLSLDEDSIPHIQDIGSTNGTEVRFNKTEKEAQLSESYRDMVSFIQENWQEIIDGDVDYHYFYRYFYCHDGETPNFDFADAEVKTRQYLETTSQLMKDGIGQDFGQPAWMWLVSKNGLNHEDVTSRLYLNLDRSQVARIMQAMIEFADQRSLRVDLKSTNPRRLIPRSNAVPAEELPQAATRVEKIDPYWVRHFNERPDACVLYCHHDDVSQIFEYIRWLYDKYPDVFNSDGPEFTVPVKSNQGQPIKAVGFANQPDDHSESHGRIISKAMLAVVDAFQGRTEPPSTGEIVSCFQEVVQSFGRDPEQPGLNKGFTEQHPDISYQLSL